MSSTTTNEIFTIEGLNNIYYKAFTKEKNGEKAGMLYVYIKCFDKNGNELNNVSLCIPNVPVKGIRMPFLNDTTTKEKYDTGAKVPEITFTCVKDGNEYNLVKLYAKKLWDAVFSFVYGLDGKLVKEVEKVPDSKSEGFIPRVHYVDGTILDVKKSDIKEIPGNQTKFLAITPGGVYFVEDKDMPNMMKKEGKKNGNFYPVVELDALNAFSLRRKAKAKETPDQMNIEKWGISVYETRENPTTGVWEKGRENIVSAMPQIKSISEEKSFIGFIGYVRFRPSYLTMVPGNKSTLHFGGVVLFQSFNVGNMGIDDIPTGEFEATVKPVKEVMVSKASATASPDEKNKDKEKSPNATYAEE